MNIYLFRHGISIDRADPACPADPERFLTDKGKKRTRAAAAGVASLGVSCDAVISSPYLRARQTAEIVAKALKYGDEIETDDALIWSRPPGDIAANLEGRREAAIMLVGHAPHLDELAGWLVGAGRAVTQMKKASLLVLECEALRRGGAIIAGYYPPRALRALSSSRW